MATAAIKHAAHKLSRDKASSADSPQIDPEKCQQEKRSIAEYYDNARPLPPDQIAQSPRNKELATSSRNIRIQDFELIKTLGTGTLTVYRFRELGRRGLNKSRDIRKGLAHLSGWRIKEEQRVQSVCLENITQSRQ